MTKKKSDHSWQDLIQISPLYYLMLRWKATWSVGTSREQQRRRRSNASEGPVRAEADPNFPTPPRNSEAVAKGKKEQRRETEKEGRAKDKQDGKCATWYAHTPFIIPPNLVNHLWHRPLPCLGLTAPNLPISFRSLLPPPFGLTPDLVADLISTRFSRRLKRTCPSLPLISTVRRPNLRFPSTGNLIVLYLQ